MRRKVLLQLVVPLLSLCVLFLLLTMDPGRSGQSQQMMEISVLYRQSDTSTWSVVRQGMEQAAVDLNAELRFLTPAGDSAAEQTELLSREAETGTDAVLLIPADREALAEAASGLSGDEEQICRALTAAAEHLRRSLEAERAAGPEREKRTAALWLSGGALLVILLI